MSFKSQKRQPLMLVVSKNRVVPFVELTPNRVMSEMVLDWGGHLFPGGIFGLHILSLLLSSQAAHDCATEVTHQYKRHTP